MFFVFAACILIMHFLIHPGTSDDQASLELTSGYTLVQWVTMRYSFWSARFIQEGIGYIMIRHYLLWRFMDAGMWIALPLLFQYLSDARGNERYLSLFLIAVFPFRIMTSAGWVCTTITYLWPVFFGGLFFALLKKMLTERHWEQKALQIVEYIIMILSLIIAINHELLAAIILMILVFLWGYRFFREKKNSILLLACSLLTLADIVFILLAPGNRNRIAAETEFKNADFGGYSLFHKLYLGILHTVDLLLDEPCALFTVLCILLVIGGLVCVRSKMSAILSGVIAIVLFGFQQMATFYKIKEVWEINFRSLRTYIPIVLGGAMAFSVVMVLWMILRRERDSFEALLSIVVFLGGIATTVVMGFTPTIYQSSWRASTFTLFAVMYTAMLVYRRLNRNLLCGLSIFSDEDNDHDSGRSEQVYGHGERDNSEQYLKQIIYEARMTAFWITLLIAAGGFDFWMIRACKL